MQKTCDSMSMPNRLKHAIVLEQLTIKSCMQCGMTTPCHVNITYYTNTADQSITIL